MSLMSLLTGVRVHIAPPAGGWRRRCSTGSTACLPWRRNPARTRPGQRHCRPCSPARRSRSTLTSLQRTFSKCRTRSPSPSTTISLTMSEMKDTNVVGNSESMDQSEDTLHALSSATGPLLFRHDWFRHLDDLGSGRSCRQAETELLVEKATLSRR